jgi:hypothetical protein
MQFIKDDIHVGFYELFILWSWCADEYICCRLCFKKDYDKINSILGHDYSSECFIFSVDNSQSIDLIYEMALM